MSIVYDTIILVSVLIGAVFGSFFGIANSMWGGIEVILPVCVVIGVIIGWIFGKFVVSFLRNRSDNRR